MNNTTSLFNTLLGSLLLLLPSVVEAAPCGQTHFPDQFDFWAGQKWNCSQVEISDMWTRFDFDRKDWDQGFGYYNACNEYLPLKRTFNALQLLKYTHANPTCDSSDWNIARWAYCWAGEQIDELDALCGPDGYIAKNFNSFWDDRTELYKGFFYGQTVVGRAKTIVHEARHAESGCSHVSCASAGECDESYFNGCGSKGMGAYAFAVHWLAHYVWHGQPLWKNSVSRDDAIAISNWTLSNKFVQDPCFRLAPITGAVISTC